MTLNLIPLQTEKTSRLQPSGQYGFIVPPAATKSQIKAAVSRLYNVQVISVTTRNFKSVTRRTGRKRLPGATSPAKHAFVTLKSGQSLTYEAPKPKKN